MKAPPSAPVAYNWTGVYGGLHVGYGAGMKDWSTSSFDYIAKGPFGGAQLGVNQQIGNWVIGLEGDVSWADIKGAQTITVGGGPIAFTSVGSATTKIDAIATIAGRLGFAADRWLVYVKGGGAWAHESHTISVTQQTAGPFPFTQIATAAGTEARFGGMAGLGAEYAFLGHWSAKAEYNYFDFGSGPRDVRLTGFLSNGAVSTPATFTATIPQQIHLFKLGLNYRFGPDAPPNIAPSPAVAGFDWSGGYVGAQGAYGIGRARWNTTNPNGSFDVKGGMAGGVVGANAQAGVFVVGVEGEGFWSGGKGASSFATPAVALGTQINNLSTQIDWLALASLRVGFVAADRWLIYGKAGVALAHGQHALAATQTTPGFGTFSFALTGDALHTGAVAGVGVEYAFGGNWSAKVEYDYLAFRQQDIQLIGPESINQPPLTGVAGFNQRVTVRQDLHLVKLGLDYHFGAAPEAVRALH